MSNLIKRRKTRGIMLGSVPVGGGAPVSVQSMTKTDTRDISATVAQILELEKAGCDIIRCAVPDMEAAKALVDIKKQVNIPLVADIHFDYRLALEALDAGVDGLRLNPGNIGGRERTEKVVLKAKERAVPIRIGVNSGSLEKDILDKNNGPTPAGMAESALRHVAILEKLSFYDIKISLKASGVLDTVLAYRMLAGQVSYPFHLGITEAGTHRNGTIKSSVGLGVMLADGLGDTIRVSLTGSSVDEVYVGKKILSSLGMRNDGIEFVSCPTCGRCQIDMITLAEYVEKSLMFVKEPLKIAVMGCAVNGPGEAREADLGIAGGKGGGLIFKKGKILRKVPFDNLGDELILEVKKILNS